MENLRLESDTTLRWKANPEPDVAGYRIVWRDTTAPTWQHSKDVGNVTRATLVGISKDNFSFGVAGLRPRRQRFGGGVPEALSPGRRRAAAAACRPEGDSVSVWAAPQVWGVGPRPPVTP